MITIDEDIYSSMTAQKEEGAITISMRVNLNGERNNIVTFNFKDPELFRECRELFNGAYIKYIVDRPRNIELEIGCGDEKYGYIYFQLTDDNEKDESPCTYNLTIYPNDKNYDLISGIISAIEKEKAKEKGEKSEHKLNNT